MNAQLFDSLEKRQFLAADVVLRATGTIAPGALVPGDSVLFDYDLQNVGDVATPAGTEVQLVASAGSARKVIAKTTLQSQLESGATRRISLRATLTDEMPTGGIDFEGRVRPAAGFGDDATPANNSVVSSGRSFTYRFGRVGNRSNVPLTLKDRDGTTTRFSIVGAGTGEFVRSDVGLLLSVAGTSRQSRLIAKSSGGDGSFRVGGVDVVGSMSAFDAPNMNVRGDFSVGGTIGRIHVRNIAGAGPISVTVAAARQGLEFIAGVLEGASLRTNGRVDELSVRSWERGADVAGTLSARDIGTLKSQRNFAADLAVAGDSSRQDDESVKNIRIGGHANGAAWRVNAGAVGSINLQSADADFVLSAHDRIRSLTTKSNFAGIIAAKAVNDVQIGGAFDGGRILAGIDLGSDGRVGGTGAAADASQPGSIGSIDIARSANRAVIAAGLDLVDGQLLNGDDTVRAPKSSSIASIIVGQSARGAFFIASQINRAKIARNEVDVAGDVRFITRGETAPDLSDRFGADDEPPVPPTDESTPTIAAVQDVEIVPGEKREISFSAVDASDRPVDVEVAPISGMPTSTFRGSVLRLTPQPDDLGEYSVRVVAKNGTARAEKIFRITVKADSDTSTRVSGTILNTSTEPLAGVPIEIGSLSALTDQAGRFTIRVPQGQQLSDFGDTLKVRGEAVSGDAVYPFIAEKLPLLLDGVAPFEGVNNFISRPIYLPPIDVANGSKIDPTVSTTVTTSAIPNASVFVSANTLNNQEGAPFTGTLSITQVPNTLTPAALPTDQIPDLVVTIQPGEMVFTQPAPLSLPNRSGFAPGTVMNLWSINPQTGQFDDVGDGVVSSDGTTITTTSGGIRNSSWHFFTPPPPEPDNPEEDDRNPDDDCQQCKATESATSEVETHSGALIETHELVTYQSQGITRGLTLRYDSLWADPRPIIHMGYRNVGTGTDRRLIANLTVEKGKFRLEAEGGDGTPYGLDGDWHFWTVPDSGSVIDAALQVDLSDQPTGRYDYKLMNGVVRPNGSAVAGSLNTQNGKVISVNQSKSAFGAGWSLAGLSTANEEKSDGSVMIVDGAGEVLTFERQSDGTYTSPAGDFSTLEKLTDGRFRRTLTTRTVHDFDAAGRIQTSTDRNGNVTRFDYDGTGNLSEWTDPVGLKTKLTYDTSGKIDTITDPAGRVTHFEHDSKGNLTTVTDPDGSTRVFSYVGRLMTGETDQLGRKEKSVYDAFGRVASAVRKDGSSVAFAPLQTQGLYTPQQTSDLNTPPEVFVLGRPEASYRDANGNTKTVLLDRAGQVRASTDVIGGLPAFNRNADNLVASESDSRGNVTSYQYDERGNVTAIRDTVSNSGTTRVSQSGTDFWLTFPQNYNSTPTLSLFVSSAVTTSGRVEIPGLGFSQDFNVNAGEVATVDIPAGAQVTSSDTTVDLGIHVTTAAPVSIYGLNRIQFTTDGYLALPTQALGTEYLVMSYRGATNGGSSVAVVATQDGTELSITPSADAVNHTAGTAFSVSLNQGEVYFLTAALVGDADLTGTVVSSNRPVAVFGSHACANVPPGVSACDHVVEQLPPVDTWGTSFVTAPLATRTAGDVFRFLASADDTEVLVNGESIGTIQRGQHIERDITAGSSIVASKPILVAQYSKGTSADGVTSDPFMVLVPPFEQFVNSYTVAAPASGFSTNFLNVVAPTDFISSMQLDGNAVDADSFSRIPNTRFSFAQLAVQPGTHTIIGNANFGLFAYGFDNADSYGYLGGQAFTPASERTIQYDSIFNVPVRSVDERGNVTLNELDAKGNIVRTTQVVGAVGGADDMVSTVTYTSNGQIDTAFDPKGQKTDYDYDAVGRVVKVTRFTSSKAGVTQQFEYDAAGNRTAVIDEKGSRTTFAYDARGRLTSTAEPDPDGAGPLISPVTTYEYDKRGNLLRTIDARGNVTRSEFDAMDQVTKSIDALGKATVFTYDGNGNVITTTDPLGAKVTRTYDVRNRVTQTIDADGGVTKFEYDLDGNLTKLIDPVGNVTAFEYDARGRLTRETDPLGKSTLYSYDGRDNLVKKVDRNARETTYAYDALDRLATESWTGTDQVINYTYDANGNLNKVKDKFSELTYTYDALNRVATVDNTGTPGAPAVKLTYAYDAAGNVISVSETINGVAGAVTSTGFDALNRAVRFTQSGTGVADKRVDLAYNPLGQYESIKRYSDLTGTSLVAQTSYAYDANNRLTSLNHTKGTTTLAGYAYTYDDDSRITQINSVIDGVVDYSYDNRDQLTGATYANATIPDEAYAYDANGNRTSSHLHGSGYETDANTGNRLKTDGTYNYTYDDEGNQIKRTRVSDGSFREFAWDHRNRLISVIDRTSGGTATQTVTFAYDAINRRIAKAIGSVSTVFIYDREDVLLDYTDSDGDGPATPSLVVRYLHGAGIDMVIAEDRVSDTHWLLSDHLGTIRDLAVTSGQSLQHRTVDAYGNVVIEGSDPLESRYVFSGREFDTELGLYYYRGRYYSGSAGQFLSDDPIGLRGGTNVRSYAERNPIMNVDPWGLDAACYVDFPDYPITIPGGFKPRLGHAGVLGYDELGRTRYYEYGRYPTGIGEQLPQDDGNIRRGQNVPDLKIGPDGRPTKESLAKLEKYLKDNPGHGNAPKLSCDTNVDVDKMYKYIEDLARDANRPKYSLPFPLSLGGSNTCKDFARNAQAAGRTQ